MKILFFIISILIFNSSFSQNLNEEYYIFDKKFVKLIFTDDSIIVSEKKLMKSKITEKIIVKNDIIYILENKIDNRTEYVVLRVFKINNDFHLSILYDKIKDLLIAKENINKNNFDNKVSILMVSDSLKNDSLKSVMTLNDKELILILKNANEELRKSKIQFRKSKDISIFFTNSILNQIKKMNFNLFSISTFLNYVEKKTLENSEFNKEMEDLKILKRTKTVEIDR